MRIRVITVNLNYYLEVLEEWLSEMKESLLHPNGAFDTEHTAYDLQDEMARLFRWSHSKYFFPDKYWIRVRKAIEILKVNCSYKTLLGFDGYDTGILDEAAKKAIEEVELVVCEIKKEIQETAAA